MVFNLYDPVKKGLMLSVVNPIVPIRPMAADCVGIDLDKAFDGLYAKEPDFGYLAEDIDFETEKRGWQFIAEIIKPRG